MEENEKAKKGLDKGKGTGGGRLKLRVQENVKVREGEKSTPGETGRP